MAPVTGTVTLTSSGTSNAIALDPTARKTTLATYLSIASTSTAPTQGVYRVEITLDPYVAGGSSQYWFSGSTVVYTMNSTSTTAIAVSSIADGACLVIDGPIAGARLNSTTWWHATISTAATVTLRSLQAVTAGP